jgi:LPXTG-site transpeptidase (sortase) family protein
MLLAVLKRALFMISVGMLAYACVLITESYVMQHYESLKFDRALAAPPKFKTKTVVSGVPIGKLTIPSVGISAIVLDGDDSGTLNIAPGHIPGTALPGEYGNAGIAAHRDTFFRNLETVREGDPITVTTLGGVYLYRVDSTEVVDPTRTDVLAPTKGAILTLVTCYPFHWIGPAPKRFIVRSQLVHKTDSSILSNRHQIS